MTKLKLLIFILILVGLVYGGITYLDQQILKQSSGEVTKDGCVDADGVHWCQNSSKTINVALFSKPLEFFFTNENAQKLNEQGLLNDLVLAINGSYFRGSFIESEHAGLLQMEGEIVENLATDNQLTHVIIYDHEQDEVSFLPTAGIDMGKYESENFTLVQTGPLVVADNVIQTELIDASANGSGRYLRTLLGITNDGQKLFVITRVSYSLGEIATEILKMDLFAGKKIDLINMDGGTSTAMFSSDLDQFNFGETKRLPLVIGVK